MKKIISLPKPHWLERNKTQALIANSIAIVQKGGVVPKSMRNALDKMREIMPGQSWINIKDTHITIASHREFLPVGEVIESTSTVNKWLKIKAFCLFPLRLDITKNWDLILVWVERGSVIAEMRDLLKNTMPSIPTIIHTTIMYCIDRVKFAKHRHFLEKMVELVNDQIDRRRLQFFDVLEYRTDCYAVGKGVA